MDSKRKVAWASLATSMLGGLLMWGLAQISFQWPPLVTYGAVVVGTTGVLVSGAMWCHIAWVWLRTRGLPLGPAIVVAIGLSIVTGGVTWALVSRNGQRPNQLM